MTQVMKQVAYVALGRAVTQWLTIHGMQKVLGSIQDPLLVWNSEETTASQDIRKKI